MSNPTHTTQKAATANRHEQFMIMRDSLMALRAMFNFSPITVDQELSAPEIYCAIVELSSVVSTTGYETIRPMESAINLSHRVHVIVALYEIGHVFAAVALIDRLVDALEKLRLRE